MIKKIFLQSIVSAMLFLIVLFSFSRVDWLSVFDLRETVIEEKLGDMYWDLYSGSAVFLESDTVLAPLDSLLSHLCEANDIERDKIKMPPNSGVKVLSASAGGHASLRQASGGRKSLLFVPPFANAEGGMHHGVERCSAAVRHCWRHSWDYISDRMGNLQRDP